MTKPRILFVGMLDSPHVARWTELATDQGWDLHLFGPYEAPAHPLMRGLTIHRAWLRLRPRWMLRQLFRNPFNVLNLREAEKQAHPNRLPVRAVYPYVPTVKPIEYRLHRRRTPRLGESEVTAPFLRGPKVLADLIRKLKPDLIHTLEFQHCGYLALAARNLMKGEPFPKWLATNYGSDIYHYRNFPEHRAQISRLLKTIDYYSCECARDIPMARELGFTGEVMPVLPNAGGFDIAEIKQYRSSFPPSQRRIVMVKGYQSFAGRALTALEAILRCRDELRGFRVVMFSAGPEVVKRAQELRDFHAIDITFLKYPFPHPEMLRYFAHARAYLGVGVSDGISTSMLEAMAMGAFPIQTNTSCCDEWIEDGRTGYSIPPDDVELIASRLRSALADDALVDGAAETNWETIVARADKEKLRPKVVALYDSILNRGGGNVAAIPKRPDDAPDSPRVSVILPTYNRRNMVGEAIDSVLAQDFSDFELIVVDDGSTDGTAELLASYKDPRIKVISQPNAGRSAARNVALKAARAPLIAFLDSDDMYLPGKLGWQVRELDRHPEAGMIYTSARCIDETGRRLGRYEAVKSGDIYRDIAFFRPVTITLPTVMVRRSVIDAAGPFDERMERFEDTDMWRRITKRTNVHAMFAETCILRTHGENHLHAQNPDTIMAALDYYAAKLKAEDGDISPTVISRGLGGLYYYYAKAFQPVPGWGDRARKLRETSFRYWPGYYWSYAARSVGKWIAARLGIRTGEAVPAARPSGN